MRPFATKKALLDIIERFDQAHVAVIGDMMMDRFIRGNVNRISPEAPVPVVDITAESYRLGGSANVVYNLYSLGSSVYTSGVVGLGIGLSCASAAPDTAVHANSALTLMRNEFIMVVCLVLRS